MAIPEFVRGKETLVIENLLRVDPVDLMRDNPAAQIVNQESYDRMVARFIPGKFDPPKVVRVLSYLPQHGQMIRLFVEDGLTRTKFFNDNKGSRRPECPDYSFDTILVSDVTDGEIENRKVVTGEEYEETKRRGVLTMVQYLRSVIPPTVEHAQIAPDRIAAHLINAWDNMAGDIAEKYSALAAFSLLASPEVPIATSLLLLKYLDKQSELLAGETPDERKKLKQALLEMASIIRESTLIRQHVAESAFMLVSCSSPVIGGERESRKQIYGLLHTPKIERSLREAFAEGSVREQMRDQLDKALSEAFRTLNTQPNGQQAIMKINDALGDEHLSFHLISEVVYSSNPTETYNQIKHKANAERLLKFYMKAEKKVALSRNELILIERLGMVTHLGENELSGLVRAIRDCEVSLIYAMSLREKLSHRDTLIRSGVKPETLDVVLVEIERLQTEVLSTDKAQSLNIKVRNLSEETAKFEGQISRQILIYQLGKIADEIFAEQVKTGFGQQIRSSLIQYIQLAPDIDPKSVIQVRQRLTTLHSFDPDIQTKVLTGEWRIIRALKEQEARKEVSRQPEMISTIPISKEITILETEIVADKSVQSTEIDREVGKYTLEERRKLVNNERLSKLVIQFRENLRALDLEHDEISAPIREESLQMLREAGKIIIGHPDIVRVIEEVERLKQENKRLREEKIRQELTDNIRDSRTHI